MPPNEAALFLCIGAVLVVGLICIGLVCAYLHIGDTDFYNQKDVHSKNPNQHPKRKH